MIQWIKLSLKSITQLMVSLYSAKKPCPKTDRKGLRVAVRADHREAVGEDSTLNRDSVMAVNLTLVSAVHHQEEEEAVDFKWERVSRNSGAMEVCKVHMEVTTKRHNKGIRVQEEEEVVVVAVEVVR